MSEMIRRAPAAPAAEPVSIQCAATFARSQCQTALDSGERPLIELAVGFVRRWAEDLLANRPTSSELRLWHELLLDLAISIEDHLPEHAADLEALANEVYATVVLANRNPVEEIMSRPSARRVLETILALGDGCAQHDVRERTQYGVSHLSNIIALLRGYNLINSIQDSSDGRVRRLSLTDLGRSKIVMERVFELPAPPSAERMPRVEKVAPVSDEPYQPPAPVTAINRASSSVRTAAREPHHERELAL